MDLTKPSSPSKTTNVNNLGGNETPLEEGGEQWRDGGVEGGEVDVTGEVAAAETVVNQQGAGDKQKFNTISYQRRTKQKVVTDYATVSKGGGANTKPRAALIQVLFNQGVSDKSGVPEERGQLEVLKQALESFPVAERLSWSWGEEAQGAVLENSWTEIVHSHSTMCKTQKHQQEALWEFVHTELTYINKLTIITDLVMAALTRLHQHGFLLEVTHQLLFSNLPSILAAHRQFWQDVMYPMLQEVRRTGKPFDPLRLEAGCLQFHGRFSSYLQYCWEEENTVEFTRKQLETNPQFHTYLMWVETHPQCERMRLGDMQAKPHQRVTKYPLLLKAVLKTTQDPHTQHTLQGMLASVNEFLDNINDYLRLKDEELALSLSAQRLDGYDVMEGMNEEIEKHVREFCRFDLTVPIRGAGPGVIRKLLLEETLKIRGRKDSKLEVVVLLFSDVLLVTKVQKKGERLKVVRPPLALDRTCGAALKDGCSFVLVEVSDVGCAVNVCSFSAPSPESCMAWLSTIQQAQETLKALRESEVNRLQEANQRHALFETTPPTESKLSKEVTEEKPLDQLEIVTSLEVKHVEEHIPIQSVNGEISAMDEEAELQTQAAGSLPVPQRKLSEAHSQSARGDFATNGQRARAVDEMVRSDDGGDRSSNQWEEEYGSEVQVITERRATWNHNRLPSDVSLPNPVTANASSRGTLSLLPGEYPDIDYPQSPSSTFLAPRSENHPEGSATGQPELPGIRVSGSRPGGARHDSDSVDEEALAESWRFSRKLKSPRLHRRRPINGQQNNLPQMTRRGSESGSESGWSAPPNFSSNSDSDCNQRRLGAKGQSAEPQLVLKLGSLKLNRGVFWPLPGERDSPEPHTSSEPELPKEMPDRNSHNKKPKVRTQRSVSNPDIITPGALLTSRPLRSAVPHSPPPVLKPLLQHSPLEGLLERARERRRDGGRREAKGKTPVYRTADPPRSPSFFAAPPQSAGGGGRETEWEEAVVTRRRSHAFSEGWRDGDGAANKNSPVGASVDWHGWCFDDYEVMDYLGPEYRGGAVDEGLLEGIQRTLTLRDYQRMAQHEDGECSQV